MTATYWAPQAWTGRHLVEGFEVEVDAAGVIGRATAAPQPSPGAKTLPGVVMPGHVNAHSHVFHRALRGRTHRQGDFWSWRDLMYDIAATLQPETLELLATAVYGEMALAGITHVGEFHYLHHDVAGKPYADPNEMSHAVIRAARSAGLKITLLSACYLTSDVDGSPPSGVQQRFSDGTVEAWRERTSALVDAYEHHDDVHIGFAAHSVRAVPEPALSVIAEASSDRPLHVHLSEQRRENEVCVAALGRTPTQVLAANGVLGPTTTAVHAIHLAPTDIRMLAESGSSVCICPSTEQDLGDGSAPAIELAQAGVDFSLGSDSHAAIDLFHEARSVELGDRTRLERRGIHDPEDLLRAASMGGAESLGAPGGELTAGQPADFICLSVDTPRLAAVADPASIVFSAVAADVTDVVVSGRQIVADRHHLALGSITDRLRTAIDAVEVTGAL